jgi:hypothetical protein
MSLTIEIRGRPGNRGALLGVDGMPLFPGIQARAVNDAQTGP